MSKYVFCDLDFTLLDDERNISIDNLEAIKEFESRGNHFVICSGRVPFALKSFKDALNAVDIITSNGALIYSNNKIIKQCLLDKDIVYSITKYALKKNINIRYFTIEKLYLLNQKYAASTSFLYDNSVELDNNKVFDELEKLDIIKLAITSDNRNLLNSVKEELEKMNLRVETAFSDKIFLEVNAINQNKGNAVIDYCKYNNIDINDTISIGDNENDLTMLYATKYSACPRNAIEDVKKIVNYVCNNDNNHGAVKELLERIH